MTTDRREQLCGLAEKAAALSEAALRLRRRDRHERL